MKTELNYALTIMNRAEKSFQMVFWFIIFSKVEFLPVSIGIGLDSNETLL